MCIPPRSEAPRCASHCGAWLRGVHHTVVSTAPNFSKTPWYASHCGVELRCVLPTAESSSAVCIMPLSQKAHCAVKIKIFANLWLVLKGQWGEILLGVNISIIKEKIWRKNFDLLRLKCWLCGVLHTAESNFSNFEIEYLGEIETEFENTLGAQMGWNHRVLRVALYSKFPPG